MLENHALRLVSLFLAMFVLGGCSGIASRMEETIAQADALDKQCEQIQSQELDPNSASDTALIWGRLEVRLKLVADDIEKVKKNTCPGIGPDSYNAVANGLEELRTSLDAVSKTVPFPICPNGGAPIANTRSCARAILDYSDSVNKELRELASGVQKIQREIGILQNKVASTATSCAREVAVWKGALEKIASGLEGLLTKDEEAVLEHYFASRFTTKISERFFDRMERLVQPIDHLLDKLDDKTYVVSTVMMALAHNDIRKQFGRAYREFLGRKDMPGNMRFALARAVCTRLQRPPAPGQRYSQIMPYLLEAFATYGEDLTDPLLGDLATSLTSLRTKVDDAAQRDSSPMAATANISQTLNAGKVHLLDVAKTVGIATAPSQVQQAEPVQTIKAASSNQAPAVEQSQATSEVASLANCEASSNAELERRFGCIRSSLADVRAMLGESDQFRNLAAAEFSARQSLTPANGSVDEEVVKRSAQLASGEYILAYQAAYSSKLIGKGLKSFDPKAVSDGITEDLAASGSINRISQQSVSYVVNQTQAVQINVANDNRLTIYNDSHNVLSPPPISKSVDDFCPTLLRLNPSLRCLAAGNRYVIELDKTFPTRHWSDSGVYERLQAIAATAKGMGKGFSADIEGYTSRLKVQPTSIKPSLANVRAMIDLTAWPTKSSIHLPALVSHCNGEVFLKEGTPKTPCSKQALEVDGNYLLALGRAAWTAQVLERWGDGAINIASIKAKAASRAEDGNLAQDRKVRIYLMATDKY